MSMFDPYDSNTNVAPYPHELDKLVEQCQYRPRWQARLQNGLNRGQGSQGLTLVITTLAYDTYNPETPMRVAHYFPVPPASYDRRSWQWWLFNCFLQVERHECMEFFQIQGERPYAPMHGPGNDPYLITVERTDLDRRTNYKGELDDGDYTACGKPIERDGVTFYCDVPVDHEHEFHGARMMWDADAERVAQG